MVLDIDQLRTEKVAFQRISRVLFIVDCNLQGGDPEKVRENQRKRFKDPASVDKIIELDNSWRQAR